MTDLNLQPEPTETPAEAPAKKKCCGKIRSFFTKEAKEGQRILNGKFWVALVVVLVIVWII